MRLFGFLSVLLILSAPAYAGKPFGLAMHGDPKYSITAHNLAYANPDAPKGGTLRMPGIGTFDTVNPFSIKGKAAEGLTLVYDRLMTRVWDEPFTLYPLIAQRYAMPKDRSSFTVYLNPLAKFTDSTPITADDVVFSFETLKEQGRPNMRHVYKLVKEIKKIDDMTVTFIFGEGHDRETVMIIAMMPVLSKKWWEGKTFDTAVLETPVSSGPYKITAVDPGRSITYERVKDYWAKDMFPNKGQFNADKIIYDYYRDDLVAFESFKAGNLDLRREYDAGKWASGYDFPAVQDGRVKKEALPHGRPEKTKGFIFNTRRAPFDDIRVRKALTLLLDFDWANKNLFHGQYKRITSYFPNAELAASGTPSGKELEILNSWKGKIPVEAFGPAWTPPSPDRRKNMLEADRLLKEAGWIIQNGKRMKDGKPFTFELLLSAPEDEKIALNFKNALTKSGITVNIRVLDAANYIGRINEYDFDMTLYYWLSTLSPGTEQILYWGCQAAKEPARWNYAGICNPAIDAMAASIARTTDRETLVATVKALDRVLMAGAYMIPLYYAGADYVAYGRKLRHPEKTPLYGMVIETWWIEPPKPPQ
jgi:microcin C transport system substrate-binding protein